MPLGEFLSGLSTLSAIPTIAGYSVGVRVSIPPYPHEGDVPEIPIAGIDEDISDEIYLSDVMSGPYGLQCAGSDGYVLAVVASHPRLNGAIAKAYLTTERIIIPNMQYRNDIGDRVASDKARIEKYIRKFTTENNDYA